MRTDITPTYRSDPHAADWASRDERVSLRLAAFATWARYDLESVARGARQIAESGVDTRTAGENLRRNLGRSSS